MTTTNKPNSLTTKITAILMAIILAVTLTPIAPTTTKAHAATNLVPASVASKVTTQAVTAAKAKTKLVAKNVTASTLTYTGKALTPKVTVKVGKKTLKAGRDYTLAIKTAKGKKVSKPKAVGTYKAVVKGKGSYKGTVTKSFKVAPKTRITASMVTCKNMTKAIASAETYWTGAIGPRTRDGLNWQRQRPNITVKSGGKTLVQGTDYTVQLAYPEKYHRTGGVAVRKRTCYDYVWEPYTYVAYITGKGKYTGTVCKSFKLAPKTKKVNGVTYTQQHVYKSKYVDEKHTYTYWSARSGQYITHTSTVPVLKVTWSTRWVKYDVKQKEAMFALSSQSTILGNGYLPYTAISR